MTYSVTAKCVTVVAEGGFKLMASKHISLPLTFAVGDPTEWFKHFKICCRDNEWSDAVKVLKLPTLLEGEALAVWMELSEAEKEDYTSGKTQMISRMAPVRFVSLEDFKGRRLLPGEPLSVFLHVLKQLLEQAMPEADAATWKQLYTYTSVPDRATNARE